MAIIASYNVADRLRNGGRVLTTCQQGRNRSGLVNAFTLINLGWTADQAIQQIQERRPNALTNTHFIRSIKGYAKLPKLAPARISA
jgi:protein-tyrosine phosphatase